MPIGCGIFRKSKRSAKSWDKVESTPDVKVSTDLAIKESGLVEENTRVLSSSGGQTKVYPKSGVQTTVSPDDTITTEADNVVQNTKRQEQRQEEKTSESKPSFWGIWGMWIGIGCAVVIGIVFLLWWFGVKRKIK